MLEYNLNFILYGLMYLIFFVVVYFFVYKKYIYSIADPLVFHLIIFSFVSVLVVLVVESKYIIHYLLCQLFFYFGFVRVKINDRNFTKKNILEKDQIKIYVLFLKIISFVFIFSNFYIGFKVGFPLLQEDPSIAKVSTFVGGLGIFRRINWGLGNLYFILSLYLYFYTKSKTYLFHVFIWVIFTILGGSKGGLFTLLIAIGVMTSIFDNITINKKYLYAILLVIVFLSLFILFKQSDSLEFAVYSFFIRLLYSGDIVFYGYNEKTLSYFQNYDLILFLKMEFDSVLGFFRISDYHNPIGYEMVVSSLSPFERSTIKTIVGPNCLFFIKGLVFFGYFGSFVYSFCIGMFVSYIRRKLFSYNKKSFMVYIYLISLNVIIFNSLIEFSYFISLFFDMLFWTLPFYVVLKLLKLKFEIKNE